MYSMSIDYYDVLKGENKYILRYGLIFLDIIIGYLDSVIY